MNKKVDLSVIILNYNTKDLLNDCLNSLNKVKSEVNFEVIVCDNGSTDGSIEMLKKSFKNVVLVENNANLGFAKGNNTARKIVKGEYILFLNSDTVVYKNTIFETLNYLKKHPDVGGVTCKLVLPNNDLDRDARRSFPTPFVALTHFSFLDRLFPHSELLSKYWYGYINPDITHEIDVIQGAYFMSPKKILDKVDWFDEEYFLDAEDIDLSYKIKMLGYKLVYFPKVKILHIKGATKGKKSINKRKPSLKKRIIYKTNGVNSMKIFYKKHLWKKYPFYINYLVILGINTIKFIRIAKLIIFNK